MVPTRMKRAGWLKLMPSRSTILTPMAALSSSRSTMWSSSKLISSTYRMPRLALASTPVSKCRSPSWMAFSMSSVPTTRSSVALTGRSTKLMRRLLLGISSQSAYFWRAKSDQLSRRAGSSLKGESAMTWICGSRAARARAAVDLPVPRSPRINTPPMRMSMAFKISASFIMSCPTMAVKGYTGGLLLIAPSASSLLCKSMRHYRRPAPT